MTSALVVLRPEPGNAATAAAIEAVGATAIRLPLFVIRPIAWTAPDPGEFDALLLTSANAPRHGGTGLAALLGLPVWAVGAATARAAQAAGFTVAATGAGDADDLVERMRAAGIGRALHLGGRDTMIVAVPPVSRSIAVYASDAIAIEAARLRSLNGSIALLHSTRAARRFTALVDAALLPRTTLRLAAISQPVASAAGPGWAALSVAEHPDDNALLAAAATVGDCPVRLTDR